MVRRKRASGKVINIADEVAGGQRADGGDQIVIEKTDVKGIFSNIFSLLTFFGGIIVFLLIGIYFSLSATLMNFTVVEDTTVWNLYGVVPETAHDGNRIITGSSTGVVEKGPWARLQASVGGVDSPFVGQVVSDRFDEISSSGDTIHLNGEPTDFTGHVDTQRLDGEYLVKCISGACEKDSYIIVPVDNIVGNVYGYLSWSSGLERVE